MSNYNHMVCVVVYIRGNVMDVFVSIFSSALLIIYVLFCFAIIFVGMSVLSYFIVHAPLMPFLLEEIKMMYDRRKK